MFSIRYEYVYKRSRGTAHLGGCLVQPTNDPQNSCQLTSIVKKINFGLIITVRVKLTLEFK